MKTLLVISGATGVGKTELSLQVAERLTCPILNADSRQIYRELPIGTAAPTAEEQARVKHYFVGTHSVSEAYSAGEYAADALTLIKQLHQKHDTLLMVGGGMMYIDAVCKGLDNIPKVPSDLRKQIRADYETKGLTWLQEEVRTADPDYFTKADIHNPQRLMHALEVSKHTGKPYSTFLGRTKTEHDFRILQVQLTRERDELYERINQRVLKMMDEGLEEEARRVYPMRGLNALNTVGYKEMFKYFDGDISKEKAVELIQQHSRNYAKRQLTWWRTLENKIPITTATADTIIDMLV